MVGRELQKIRPYGEDHQGLVRGREGVHQDDIRIGKAIDGWKK